MEIFEYELLCRRNYPEMRASALVNEILGFYYLLDDQMTT